MNLRGDASAMVLPEVLLLKEMWGRFAEEANVGNGSVEMWCAQMNSHKHKGCGVVVSRRK